MFMTVSFITTKKTGNNPNIHQQGNRQRDCGACIKWNTTQQWKGTNQDYTKWKKQTENVIYSVIPFIWHSGKGITAGTEINRWLPRAEAGRRGHTTKGHKGIWWGDENILYIDTTQTATFVKSHQTIHLKRVNFTVYKLYFNKPDFKNKPVTPSFWWSSKF